MKDMPAQEILNEGHGFSRENSDPNSVPQGRLNFKGVQISGTIGFLTM
jgi:hypothetical protein